MDGANEQLRALGAPGLSLETAERPSRPVGGAPQRLVGAYSKALLEQARANPDIVVLDADLALDCGLLPFKDEFPERFVECGIAEQDMVSQAGGMALRGLLPVVHSFASFLSTRPNEQIYNNATERTKIVYVGSLAGLVPGGPGHSHQSVRDISTLAAVPGLVMIEPCNEAEVGFALDYCLNGTSESSYLRLVSVPWEVPFELPGNYRLVEGRGVTLTEGNDAVIFASGPVMLSQAFEAARTLRDKHGIEVKVVNLPWLNRVDDDWLKETVWGVPWVFTVDNHYVAGGQGDILCGVLAEADLLSEPLRVHKFGLRDIPACGTNDEVLRAHLLDAESLTDSILAELRRD